MLSRYIKLESQTLHGDNGVATYFIDRVDVIEGRHAHSNLRAVKNITEARKIARAYATEYGCHVDDETLSAIQSHGSERKNG